MDGGGWRDEAVQLQDADLAAAVVVRHPRTVEAADDTARLAPGDQGAGLAELPQEAVQGLELVDVRHAAGVDRDEPVVVEAHVKPGRLDVRDLDKHGADKLAKANWHSQYWYSQN